MPSKHHPRRGSLQFWPRARSSKHAARVRAWAEVKEAKVLGFIGYKAGMTHLLLKEGNKGSPREDMNVFTPVTVVECPPMRTYSVRFYKRNDDGDLQIVSEVFSKKVDKEFERKTKSSKKENKAAEEFDRVTITVYSQVKLTGIGKKKVDLVEMEVGGKDLKEKADYAMSLLDKEIKVSDVFKDAQFVDVHSVTKGKGFSGVVKKFGVKVMQHKAEKTKRGIGTMGAWTPTQVTFKTPQTGKFGYHLRTEYNKTNVKVGTNPEEINPKGGFVRYGVVKNEYLLIKGSIPGAAKRPITITEALRTKANQRITAKDIVYTSLESRQG